MLTLRLQIQGWMEARRTKCFKPNILAQNKNCYIIGWHHDGMHTQLYAFSLAYAQYYSSNLDPLSLGPDLFYFLGLLLGGMDSFTCENVEFISQHSL